MITFETELYVTQLQRWPSSGRHIIGQFDDNSIIVYQAYKPSIADYAVQHNKFGGQDFSWTVNIQYDLFYFKKIFFKLINVFSF